MTKNIIVLCFDTETDGYPTSRDFCSQIPYQAYFKYFRVSPTDNWKIISREHSRNFLINGVTKIKQDLGSAKRNITPAMINNNPDSIDKSTFIKRLKKLVKKIKRIAVKKDCEIVLLGHNLKFDIGCLERFTQIKFRGKEGALFPIETPIYCTMSGAGVVNFCKLESVGYANYKWPKLVELAEKMHIKTSKKDFHDAKYDVIITCRCFLALKRKLIDCSCYW